MATGDAYSRSVQIAKIVLPLLALAILSTLFLVSGDIDPEGAVPYAEIDVEEAAREQRLTNPQFAAVGTDGAAIELSAAEAKPDLQNEARVNVAGIEGSIELPDAGHIALRAGGATVDLETQSAGLVDDVHIISTAGYDIRAERLMVRLDRGELNSFGPVSVVTPFGSLQAGNMVMRQQGETYRLVFNNKVKLIYIP